MKRLVLNRLSEFVFPRLSGKVLGFRLKPVLRTVHLLALSMVASVYGQHAVEVVSYDQGSTAAQVFGSDPIEFFNDAAVALGSPERFTGEGSFPGAVTPFNPAFLQSEIVSIGEGGHLTLRLSNVVVPLLGESREIGFFTNAVLADTDFPNGVAGDPVSLFGVDSATVEFSDDGLSWVTFGPREFSNPAAGYADVGQTVESDFQKPFSQSVSSFDGLSLSDPNGTDILEVLDGSGGGEWLDISDTGLSEISFVRLSVADDGNDMTQLNFELDAVSIARDAMSVATVPEPSSLGLVLMAVYASVGFVRRRR